MHNRAVSEHCLGEFLFLLNNDVFLEGDWTLDEMVAWARLDWVGTVGICLRYSHGAIQHGGIRARFGGVRDSPASDTRTTKTACLPRATRCLRIPSPHAF